MRTRWDTSLAHRLVSTTRPDRLRNHAPLDRIELVGPPMPRGALGVDVASGRVIADEADFVGTGALPLRFTRRYSSGFAHRDSSLGPGWAHTFEVALWHEPDRTVVRAPDGRELEFDRFGKGAFRAGETQGVWPWRDGSLTRRHGEGFTYAEDRVRYTLDSPQPGEPSRGRLTAIQRPEGARIEVVHDGDRPARVIAPGGRELRFHYDGARLISIGFAESHGRPAQRIARFEYDPGGDLVAVIDAAGHATRYEYHAHLLVRRTDRTGRSTYFGYDGAETDARCVRTWSDGGAHDHAFDYKPAQGVTVASDALDRRTKYRFDPIGLLLERGLERFEYDAEARCVRIVDMRGGVTAFEHDEYGVSRRIEPDGATWTIERDPRSRPVRAVDPRGAEWRFHWDSADRLIEERDPLGHVRRWHYEDQVLRAIEQPTGTRSELAYDEHLALVAIEESGRRTEFVRDARGRTIEVRASGTTLRLRYDALDRVVERHGDGQSLRFEYDAEGRLLRADGSRRARWEYDASGALAALEDDEQRVEWTCDPNGRLEALRGSSFGLWRFVRDRLGRVTEEHDPAGRRWLYRYADASDRPSVVFLPSGERLEFTYDVCERVVRIAHSDDVEETFAYAPGGDRIEAIRTSLAADGRRLIERRSALRFTHDLRGRVVRESQDEHAVELQYDALGRVRAIASSLGARLGIEWDDRGWTALAYADREHAPMRRCAIARDEHGRPSEMHLAPRLAVHWTHETSQSSSSRVLARRLAVDGRTVDEVIYRYAADGALDAIEGTRIAPSAVVRPKFAERARVVTALPSADPAGYERGTGGELTTRPNGGGTTHYRYFANGALRSVVGADGVAVGFEYDALGRVRAVRREGEVYTRLWAGSRWLHELTHAESRVTTWIFAPDAPTPIVRLEGGAALFANGRADEPAHSVCTEDGTQVFAAWIDPRRRVHPVLDEVAWPWRPDGSCVEPLADLSWRGLHGEVHDRRPLPLAPDPAGAAALFADVPETTAMPRSMRLIWRVSRDAERALLRSLAPPTPSDEGSFAHATSTIAQALRALR